VIEGVTLFVMVILPELVVLGDAARVDRRVDMLSATLTSGTDLKLCWKSVDGRLIALTVVHLKGERHVLHIEALVELLLLASIDNARVTVVVVFSPVVAHDECSGFECVPVDTSPIS
jgi:hypothetical protein